MIMDSFTAGFFVSLGLIAAIGAQNAFILKQGLLRQYVFLLCSLCALSDAVLISSGVFGFAMLVDKVPLVLPVARYGGAAFLIFYGAKSFWACFKHNDAMVIGQRKTTTLKQLLGTWAAMTWLNPHVYLDTVVLLGSTSTHYGDKKWVFALGAAAASFAFFYTLGYGASLLAPLFKKPITWRILELGIGITMWSIASQLIF